MDLEVATNLIFEGGLLWPTGRPPPEQAPKSSWRATAFKLCGDAAAASAAAIDTPRGEFAPTTSNSSCERVFVAVLVVVWGYMAVIYGRYIRRRI